MLALFTGLRDSNATTLREEIIDWKRGGFVIPMSKTTPFTIPFGPTVPMHAQPRVENQRSLWRRVRGSAHGDRHLSAHPDRRPRERADHGRLRAREACVEDHEHQLVVEYLEHRGQRVRGDRSRPGTLSEQVHVCARAAMTGEVHDMRSVLEKGVLEIAAPRRRQRDQLKRVAVARLPDPLIDRAILLVDHELISVAGARGHEEDLHRAGGAAHVAHRRSRGCCRSRDREGGRPRG